MPADWLDQLTPDNLKLALRIAATLRRSADACAAGGFNPEAMTGKPLVNVVPRREAGKPATNATPCERTPDTSEPDRDHIVNILGTNDGKDSEEVADETGSKFLRSEGRKKEGEGVHEANLFNEFDGEAEDEFTPVFADVTPVFNSQLLSVKLADLARLPFCPSNPAAGRLDESTSCAYVKFCTNCGLEVPLNLHAAVQCSFCGKAKLPQQLHSNMNTW